MLPTRYTHLSEARARFGDRVDRLGAHFSRVDVLADAVVASIDAMPMGVGSKMFKEATRHGIARVPEAPESFKALFAQAEHVPLWVDWATLDRGGRVLLRAGALGGIVLGLRSLVLGYTSPAGNKPLAFSGRLAEQAARRLHETARFVQATIVPGGLRPHRDGYAISLHVRLMHAKIRKMLLASGRWDAGAWGAPLNEHDQAGTSLLFSIVVLDGLRRLGVRIAPVDAEAYMHLWRYSAYLMGIDSDVIPVTEVEGRRLADLIGATQGEPDEDSRRLTRALLHSPLEVAKTPGDRRNAERVVRFSAGMCRELVGTEFADKLGVPQSTWRFAVPFVRRLVSGMEFVRESVPFASTPVLWAGARYWDRVIEIGLAGATAEFGLPQALGRAA